MKSVIMDGMFIAVRNFRTVYKYSTVNSPDIFDWNILFLENST